MKTLFILWVLSLSLACYGQVSVKNTSLTRPDTNILYLNIDNRLVIEGKPKNAAVIITRGRITKLSDSVYSVQVTERGENWFVVTDYGRTVFRKKFKALTLTSFPAAQLGSYKDSILTISEIQQQPFLNVIVPNSFYHHDGAILRFDMEIIKRSGVEVLERHTTEGHILTNTQKGIVASLESGDKIIFSRILVSEPSSRLVSLRLNIYIR